MQPHQLTCHFLKHARIEYFICEREKRCENFYISIYSNKNENLRFLQRMIAARLDHEELVSSLFRRVDGKDKQLADEIIVHARKMTKTLSSRRFRHSKAAGLCNQILPLVNNVLDLAMRHRDRILNEMRMMFYSFLFDEFVSEDGLSLVSGEIGAMQTLLNLYIDNMREYHQTLNYYQQYEQMDDHSIKEFAILKQYTTQFAQLISKTVSCTTITCRRLAEWRSVLCHIENGELNN